MKTTTDADAAARPIQRPWLLAVIDVALIFLLLFVFAGSPPPGDDEPHYLGKAKQYWNPDWLAGDFFLEAPDAHVVFNWTIGWLTLFFSLKTTAWIGRCAAWLMLAIAWRRLNWALLPRPLVALWTMALFLVFQEHGTAAREWIVGGVEAKCFAYVFVILGLEQLVRGRWHWVWPLLGIGAAFHVLVGGWCVVAGLLAWGATKDRPSLAGMLPSLIAGGLLSLPGLLPGLMLSWNAEPALVNEANQIYVFYRLKHHLVIYEFPWQYKLQFCVVLVAWLVVCYFTRADKSRLPLRRFILGAIVIGIVGIVVDQSTMYYPEIAASLLRFYWYRLPDMMAPLGLSLALAGWALGPRSWPPPKYSQLMLAMLIVAPLAVLSWDFAQQRVDGRPTADIQGHVGDDDPDEYSDWLKTCVWIETNTRSTDRFMIPPNITSFRWYAQRSEVVSFKDIPQDPAGVVEWESRLYRVRRWYADVRRDGWNDDLKQQLLEMASPDIYDFQYLITSRSRLPLEEVFATSHDKRPAFCVYRVPSPSVAEESIATD